MKTLINIIFAITWCNKFGTSLKYRFKRTKFKGKPLGWSIKLFVTHDAFVLKKWESKSFLNWFKISPNYDISGVADPFLIRYNNNAFLFFETIVKGKGEIWCSPVVNNKIDFPTKVLNSPYHLSYPNVFEHDGEFYMIPECSQSKEVVLYKSINFPLHWEPFKILFQGEEFVDTNLLIREGVFYWFTYDLKIKKARLFFSDSLDGIWNEHDKSPFDSNRNAGDFIFSSDKIIRPVQFSNQSYGQGVDLKEIIVLTQKDFLERNFKVPFLRPKKGFNLNGIHHITILATNNEKLIAVDGKNNNFYKVLNYLK